MMKKLLITCILILSLFGLTSAATLSGVSAIGCKVGPVFGPELVTNGGMEDGNPPTGWYEVNYPDTYERSSVKKNTGTYSAHVIEASSAAAGFGRNSLSDIPLVFESGKTYIFTFWYYFVSGNLRLTLTNGGGNTYYYYSSPMETWTLVVINFLATSGVSGIAFTAAVENTEFYIDDVSVREIQ